MADIRESRKCAVVVDEDLPAGLMLNATACLAVTLGPPRRDPAAGGLTSGDIDRRR